MIFVVLKYSWGRVLRTSESTPCHTGINTIIVGNPGASFSPLQAPRLCIELPPSKHYCSNTLNLEYKHSGLFHLIQHRNHYEKFAARKVKEKLPNVTKNQEWRRILWRPIGWVIWTHDPVVVDEYPFIAGIAQVGTHFLTDKQKHSTPCCLLHCLLPLYPIVWIVNLGPRERIRRRPRCIMLECDHPSRRHNFTANIASARRARVNFVAGGVIHTTVRSSVRTAVHPRGGDFYAYDAFGCRNSWSNWNSTGCDHGIPAEWWTGARWNIFVCFYFIFCFL